jgi:hypothetical protein
MCGSDGYPAWASHEGLSIAPFESQGREVELDVSDR